jgi:hypothetical protein
LWKDVEDAAEHRESALWVSPDQRSMSSDGPNALGTLDAFFEDVGRTIFTA